MTHTPKILNEVGRCQNTLMRGHGATIDKMKPAIGRTYQGEWSKVLEKERRALEHFRKRSIPYITSKPKKSLDWLCLMQHYGCPTRLLDFTSNPLVALFFASDPGQEEDGEIIIVDATSKVFKSPGKSDIFTVKDPFVYHPPHYCGRITGQSGCFIVCPEPNEGLKIDPVKKVAVPKKLKESIRRELATMGVTHSHLFPGLTGICEDLKDTLIHGLDDQALFDQFPDLL
ncbi:FRG domain-containing protein [Prosthecobacter sp.]|jgi:hypothetical protein|uniref:FRG domain-containing protein n=1 Tax=Prosthecobacter sp. TaxID=1965333 RepID=UPI0037830B78